METFNFWSKRNKTRIEIVMSGDQTQESSSWELLFACFRLGEKFAFQFLMNSTEAVTWIQLSIKTSFPCRTVASSARRAPWARTEPCSRWASLCPAGWTRSFVGRSISPHANRAVRSQTAQPRVATEKMKWQNYSGREQLKAPQCFITTTTLCECITWKCKWIT